MPKIISELVNVMLDTEEFFQQAREWKARRAMVYLGIISFMILLVNWLFIFYGVSPAGIIPLASLLMGTWYLAYYITLAYFIAMLFFVPTFAFLVSKLLARAGSPTGFSVVLRTAAYGITPGIITLWIPVVGVLFLLWSGYLISMGLGVYNNASLKKNGKAVVLGGGIMFLLGFLLFIGIGMTLVWLGGGEISQLWDSFIPFSG